MAHEPAPQLFIDSFCEGVLALIGHDLRIEAERFEVRAAHGNLSVRVALASLRVVGCMVKGRLVQNAPSPSERAEIEQRMHGEILGIARDPEARLEATLQRASAGWSIAGTLALHGLTRPLQALAARTGEALEATVELAPSQFGIAPFRALGGALRIADRVVVRVRLPLNAAAPGADLDALSAHWQRGTW